MARYIITVLESSVREVLYTIDAEDEMEAREKAAIGDSLSEEVNRDMGVTGREVESVALCASIPHPLPVGTKIRTIGGAAQGDWDEDDEDDAEGNPIQRRTAPGEVGEVITEATQNGEDGWSYSVVFSPSGAWIHLDEKDLSNPEHYEVLS